MTVAQRHHYKKPNTTKNLQPQMSSLSATELSRLHRQRRLECSSPIHRVTPINLKRDKRRGRRNSGNGGLNVSADAVPTSKELTVSSAAYSFDEEVIAANCTTNEGFSKDAGEIVKSPPLGLITATPSTNHNRSFSFSSFSVPTDTTTESFKSPAPHAATANAVTPPDSPGHPSATPVAYNAMSPNRRPSPTPSLGTYLDNKPANNRTPNRPVSRSNSSRSMPQKVSSKKKSKSSGKSKKSFETDMPMDELMAVGNTRSKSRDSRRPPTRNTSLLTDRVLNTSADDSLACASLPSSATSTALVVARNPKLTTTAGVLNRLAEALQLETPPYDMSAEELHLWDVVQNLTKEAATNQYAINSSGPNTSTQDATYWKQKYEQREKEWSTEQSEHDRALRAIQRVLADVTTEREDAVEKLKEELEISQQQRDATILKLTQKLKEMQQEVNAAKGSESEQVSDLKSRLELLQNGNAELQQDLATNQDKVTGLESALQQQETEAGELNKAVKDLREMNEKQAQHVGHLEEEMNDLRLKSGDASKGETSLKMDANDDQDLRKELDEKTSSLENAKMIIASLENANGSLARELRAKLKEKEEELAKLTSTSADRKRTLDSLATELRELQRQQHQPRLPPKQLANQRVLCQLLEKNVKALRQAAVQHEARNDQSSVDRISQIVSETFTSLKQNLESWDTYIKSNGQEVAEPSNNHHPGLETLLSRKNEELKVLKKEIEQIKAGSNQETLQLQQEVESLKQQLSANNEALVKKGRELAVLKDSLNLEENGVGYISDDGTDGDETEQPIESAGHFPGSTEFSGSLLVHGGPGVAMVHPNSAEMSGATAAEIQMLKNEIIKQQKEREANASQLRAEKESLANAKMIISSLEKANKSMLEDLRSRLQDSNTAIASLLEKSIEHEKTIAMLRKELDTCRQEKEKEEQKATANLTKLRDENMVFSMRLSAKDREVEELQNTLAQYEGQEVPISKVRLSSVEEKKDDPESDEDSMPLN